MISFGNAASSHSGLTPLKTAYKKRGELHWHCFQVSYARAQLAKNINLHQKELSMTFRRNIRYMLIIGLSSQIAVRAETVNVSAHHVGCNT